MTHSEAFLAAKYGGFHTNMAAFTNDYLLKHGNFFMKPTLHADGFVYPAISEAARYRIFRDVKCEPLDHPINFAIKQEKPPTPPASASPSPSKSPPSPSDPRASSPTLANGVKPQQQQATWIPGVQKLSWDDSTVASYNPDTKMFRCVVCNAVGFLSRIAEHYLGTHTSAKVFQCLHCPYSSTWSRCVRMHMAKHHGVPNAPPSLWKGQPLLEEIFHLLTSLKTSVDSQGRERMDPSEINDKKFVCPKCPYTTDRRDLYLRHENIHKEDKPYHCYVCFKLFNRADHVKKHFLRIHRGHPYDISLVRRRPPRVTSNKSNNFSVDKLIANDKPPKVEIVEEEEEIEDAMDLSCKDDSSSEKQQLKTNYLKDDSSPEKQQLKTYLKADSSPEKQQLKTTFFKDDSSSEKQMKAYHHKDDSSSEKQQQLKTFQCPSCEWEGVDSWCLRRHMNVHIKGFECPICEFKTGKAERLFTHVYRAHRKLVCTKCKFMTELAQDFEVHIKECCVEIVVGNAFDKLSEDTSSDDAADFKFDSLNTQFNLPLENGQMFESPHRLTDLKGSVSLIPLHNSISYCYPANAQGFAPTEDFGKMNLGATNGLNGKVNLAVANGLNGKVNGVNGKMLNGLVNGDTKGSSSGVKQCKMDVKAELASPVQSSSDSGVTDLTADDDADITCFHCGCEFADSASLDTHTELHHSPLASSATAKSTANKTGAKRHKFSCAVCNYRSDTQRRILEHMRYHTGEVLQCGACAFTAVCDSTLEGHVRERHGDGEKRCPHCGFLAVQKVPFIRHYRKCHHSKSCSRCRVIKRSLDPKLEKDELSILLETSKNQKSSEEVRPYLHHNPYSRRSNAITPYSHCDAAMSRVAVAIPPLLQRTATDTAESLQRSAMDELMDKSERERKSRKQTMPRKLLHHAKSKMSPKKKIRTVDDGFQQGVNDVHQDSKSGFQQERDVVHRYTSNGFNEDRNARNAYRSSRIANRQGRKKAVRDRHTLQRKLVRGRNTDTICDTSKRRPHIRKKLLKFSNVPSSSCNRRCVMGHGSPLVFRSGVNYVRHLFWCHHARRFGCHLCSERFSHEYQVLLHKRNVHEN